MRCQWMLHSVYYCSPYWNGLPFAESPQVRFTYAVSWPASVDALPIEITQLCTAIDAIDRCSGRDEDERGEIVRIAKWSSSNGLLSHSSCLISPWVYKFFVFFGGGGRWWWDVCEPNEQTTRVVGCVVDFNPLNTQLNPICHLLTLLGAHHILHVSSIRVKLPVHNMPIFNCMEASLPL